MGKRVLCDLNIWLDYYCGTRPSHDAVRRFIRAGQKNGVSFMVPLSCLANFFYLCKNDFKSGAREANGELSQSSALVACEMAWACVENLLNIAVVVGADGSDALIAYKHRRIHSDYEDDMVMAAALRAGIDCLVTNDRKLRNHAPMLALTPDEAFAYLGLDL